MIHRVAKCCLHEKTSMFKKNGGGSCPQVPVVVGTKYLLVGTRYYIKETRKKNSSIVSHRAFVVNLRNIVIQIILLLDN